MVMARGLPHSRVPPNMHRFDFDFDFDSSRSSSSSSSSSSSRSSSSSGSSIHSAHIVLCARGTPGGKPGRSFARSKQAK
eukprot:5067468-Heterocapsa_arctica.AAC.1